jgi:hypothetical protein
MDQRADTGGFLDLVEELRSEEVVAGNFRSWLGINWDDNWASENTVSIGAAFVLGGFSESSGSSSGGGVGGGFGISGSVGSSVR